MIIQRPRPIGERVRERESLALLLETQKHMNEEGKTKKTRIIIYIKKNTQTSLVARTAARTSLAAWSSSSSSPPSLEEEDDSSDDSDSEEEEDIT